MKKLIALCALLSVTPMAFGQISITAADMPIPTGSFNMVDFSSTAAVSPVPGTNAIWNYSTYLGTSVTLDYYPATDTFFTHAGADIYSAGFKTLTPGFGYNLWSELDFNASNIREVGIDIPYQLFNLSTFTGSSGDSLVVPAQRALSATPKTIFQFPCTAGTSWSTNGKSVADFSLTVGAVSMVNTPGQIVYYTHRKDSITGWGKMTVHTPTGPSIPYDVLMDKISSYTTDSFYLSGSPASLVLLSTFGIAQGQKTDSGFKYIFFRKGTFCYLVMFNYDTDATYATPVNKYYNSDALIPANVGVGRVGEANFTTVLFPNPCTGKEVNLLISGRDVSGGRYIITDAMGRTIQSARADITAGAVHVSLNSQLTGGNYFITIMDRDNNRVVTEPFVVAQ